MNGDGDTIAVCPGCTSRAKESPSVRGLVSTFQPEVKEVLYLAKRAICVAIAHYARVEEVSAQEHRACDTTYVDVAIEVAKQETRKDLEKAMAALTPE